MLRTRMVMGSLLAALTLGVLLFDNFFAPWYPFQFALFAIVGALGCWEILGLIAEDRRPSRLLCHLGVQATVAVNWIRPLHHLCPECVPWNDPWHLILGVLASVLLLAFLRELALFRGPGEALARVALTLFVVAYLGLLASFLAQLRWLPSREQAANALMLAVFVPKCCDIGAYASGRLFGKHRMTPLLSPKKTWEGAAGGILLAVVTALCGTMFVTHAPYYLGKAIAFGITVGVAGMLGDLAESLIKREGQKKDASAAVPGFGGILDVVDSVLFAAPVAFIWLTTPWLSPLG